MAFNSSYVNKPYSYKTDEFYVRNQITTCEEWQDFKAFEHWAISNGYKDDLYLNRKNKDKNYSPDNCCWETLHQIRANHR